VVVDIPRRLEDEGGGGDGAGVIADGAAPKRPYEGQLKKRDTVERTCLFRTACSALRGLG
jgi:hypothetical protein